MTKCKSLSSWQLIVIIIINISIIINPAHQDHCELHSNENLKTGEFEYSIPACQTVNQPPSGTIPARGRLLRPAEL